MKNSEIEWSEVEPICLLRTLLVNAWVMILAALTAAMLVCAALQWIDRPQYASSMTFSVASRSAGGSYYANGGAASRVAATFTGLFGSDLMNEKIAASLGVSGVPAKVTAVQIDETQLVRVTLPFLASRRVRRDQGDRGALCGAGFLVSRTAVLNVLNRRAPRPSRFIPCPFDGRPRPRRF